MEKTVRIYALDTSEITYVYRKNIVYFGHGNGKEEDMAGTTSTYN